MKNGLTRRTFAGWLVRGLAGISSWVGGWISFPLSGWGWSVRESFGGAWQRNVTIDPPANILGFAAVFACVTGISGDIAKLCVKLVRDVDGIWEEVTPNDIHGNTTALRYLPVLRKPNHYQNRIQFLTTWMISKLLWGNAYMLKQRDPMTDIVIRLYPLAPQRIQILVADDGSVYYQLYNDQLSQIETQVTVPASEIIHDLMNPLFHPLVGVSPLYACGLAATLGNRILINSADFFTNAARPSGILSTPLRITNEQALIIKERWQANYSGANSGKIAVLGDDMKFQSLNVMPAETAQLIEQLEWTVEDVARAFHYPLIKLQVPQSSAAAANPEPVNVAYYSDCLQIQIESIELCLDEGLELPDDLGTELDVDNLLRMDTKSLMESNQIGVLSATLMPNEARKRLNKPPVEGGDAAYLQQQNYSLAALAKRDAAQDPFAKDPLSPNPAPVHASSPASQTEPDMMVQELTDLITRELSNLAVA